MSESIKVMEDAMLAAGVDPTIIDLAKMSAAASLRRLAQAEPLPPDVTSDHQAAVTWCEGHGGHVDSGSMFFFTCKRCGFSEDP